MNNLFNRITRQISAVMTALQIFENNPGLTIGYDGFFDHYDLEDPLIDNGEIIINGAGFPGWTTAEEMRAKIEEINDNADTYYEQDGVATLPDNLTDAEIDTLVEVILYVFRDMEIPDIETPVKFTITLEDLQKFNADWQDWVGTVNF